MKDDGSVISNQTPAASMSDAALRSVAEAYPLLRQLGGHAHQLRAAARAADHFLSQTSDADRDTGAWLISSAFGIADDLATELDGLARALRERPGESAFSQRLRVLRTRAHQLHAATKAADHFLEQDGSEDRSTGSWLIAYALGLADKLASELEDLASSVKRGAGDAQGAAAEAQAGRRPGPAVSLRDVSA